MRGQIRKRGKSWSVIVYLGRNPQTGKKQRKWYTHATRRDAEAQLAQLLVQVQAGGGVPPTRLRSGDYLEQWLRDYAVGALAPSTLMSYTRIIHRHLIPGLGKVPLMSYEGPLPASGAPKEVKVNITIRERLVYSLVNQPVLRGYEEYDDLPQGAEVLAYSLDEIVAEKVVALMDRARNEPRDLYDVWYLMSGDHINLGNLINAVEQKWSFRGKRLEDVRDEFRNKKSRLQRLWEPRLSAQMSVLPAFETVYRAVARVLRQAGLTGKTG